jgi:hypothetical protein
LLHNDWIETVYPTDALLEVFGPRPCVEVLLEIAARVTELGECRRDLRAKLGVDSHPLLLRGRTEVELVKVVEPGDLGERLGRIVDTQVDCYLAPAVPATAPRPPSGRRLAGHADLHRLLGRR